jgi:serine/threonine-protein kinase
VWLPPPEALDAGDCYVPAGWFVAGGDPKALNALPRHRLWCDGAVFRRFPVTNAQYIAFLDDLVSQGREEEALRHVPRERAGRAGEQGAMFWGYDGGRFGLVPDAQGDMWHPDWPVMYVDWHGARAYATWYAAVNGRGWRLPFDPEWEKAVRGVDSRFYPWGDGFDPSWACMADSHAGRRLPSVVESYPVDESPYGVRGMAGNMEDWCADAWRDEGPQTDGRCVVREEALDGASNRVFRGGGWYHAGSELRASYRNRGAPSSRSGHRGFRLARSIRTGSTLGT